MIMYPNKNNSEHRLKVKGNIIIFKNEKIDYNELLDLSVVRILEEKAKDYFFDSPFVNELYRDYFLPFICIEEYMKDKVVEVIDIREASSCLKAILLDYAVRNNILVQGNSNYLLARTKYNIYIAITAMYLGLVQFKNKRGDSVNKKNQTISFCRTQASYKKISKVLDDNILYESAPGVGDIYGHLSLVKRWKCLFNAIKQQKIEIKKMKEFMNGNNYTHIYYSALEYYKKRTVHTFFYENVAENIVLENHFKKIITGNNLDRFAILEERLAQKQNLVLECIPHGIEYGYRFPKCFVGDKFFAMSQNAVNCLNKLYSTEKFVYDKNLTELIFKVANEKKDRKPCIVYFSEPREPEVNIRILRDLLAFLNYKNIPLCIKHHPKDKLDDYKEFSGRIIEIKELHEAICGNVCLSRKSTTLLEGIYNNSRCAAIITNQKDKSIFFNFPSLQDSNIAVYYNTRDAAEWAVIQYNLLLNEKDNFSNS